MDEKTGSWAEALVRLRRAQGQLAAVIAMIEAERDRRDVVTQLAHRLGRPAGQPLPRHPTGRTTDTSSGAARPRGRPGAAHPPVPGHPARDTGDGDDGGVRVLRGRPRCPCPYLLAGDDPANRGTGTLSRAPSG